MLRKDGGREERAQDAEELTPPRSLVSIVKQYTQGSTGRIWSLPFDIKVFGEWTPKGVVVMNGPSSYAATKGVCEFLREADPDMYSRWYRTATPLARAALGHRASPEDSGMAAFLATKPEEAGHRPKPTPVHVATGGPIEFDIPQLKRGHWLYDRHRVAGNYVYHKASDKELDAEAQSDVDSITSYLEAYRELASKPLGRRLFEASFRAQFRDPYVSCMELCLVELKIPSHFLALIHYGIGVHGAVGDALRRWKPLTKDGEMEDAFVSTRAVFRRLSELWAEDFPHQSRAQLI